jgi:Ca-activated chloride channel family protein
VGGRRAIPIGHRCPKVSDRSSAALLKVIRTFLLMFSALALPAAAQQQSISQPGQTNKSVFGAAQPRTQQDDTETFKVDVKLVNVFVSVQDQNGAPVSNLKKENFQLLEDDHPEKIAVFNRESELPLSIVLGIDASLSTRKDLKLELESARRFVHEIVRPQDGLSLYEFSEVVDELVPFTPDLKRIDHGIDHVQTGAATALYDAIYLGSGALENRQGRKVMVLITDGGDTMSKTNYQEAVRAAEEAEAIIYSIIVVPIEADAGRDIGGEHALIEISRTTGGKHYYATSIASLDKAFQQISEELRTQYLLAYYPSRHVTDSDFRRIQVRVTGDADTKLRARCRAGYFTTKSR